MHLINLPSERIFSFNKSIITYSTHKKTMRIELCMQAFCIGLFASLDVDRRVGSLQRPYIYLYSLQGCCLLKHGIIPIIFTHLSWYFCGFLIWSGIILILSYKLSTSLMFPSTMRCWNPQFRDFFV